MGYEYGFDKISLEFLIDYSSEDNYAERMDKTRFYNIIRYYNIDLLSFFRFKELSTEKKEIFNILLNKLKKLWNINIIDSLLYLEKDYSNIEQLIGYLDGETKHLLKEELSKSHHIKLPKNRLKELLGDGK